MKVYQYYKELPPWGKGLVAIGVLGAGVATYYIGRNVYASIARKAKEKKEGEVVNDSAAALDKLIAAGVTPSYPKTQFKIWADAMEECYQGWGTCDGDSIFVNLKNDADLLMLISSFGVRTISSGKWNPEPDTTGALPKIIRSELSGDQIDTLNEELQKKGITYRF